MHRQIMAISDTKIHIDHIDQNGLNNCRNNLRLCSISQNNANRKALPNKTSQYLGVCYVSERNKWVASISKNNKTKILGRFFNEKSAALAYNKAAKEIHGEFARLNTII